MNELKQIPALIPLPEDKNPHDTVDFAQQLPFGLPHSILQLDDENGHIYWKIDGNEIENYTQAEAFNYAGLHIHAYRTQCTILGFLDPGEDRTHIVTARDKESIVSFVVKVKTNREAVDR